SYIYSWMGNPVWQFNNNYADLFPAFWDHQIFPGGLAVISALVCLIIWLFRRRYFLQVPFDHHMKLLSTTALLIFLFYLRVGSFSMYKIIYELPGFGAMRALQRI